MKFRPVTSAGDGVSVKTALFICLGLGTLFFTLHDLMGLINGGGLFSAVSAIRAAEARVPSVDVDGASLRTPLIVFCALLTTMICVILRLRLAKNSTQLILLLGVLGGGLSIDAVYGPLMIENYLARSGYRRCDVRDRAIGVGRGRVWFDNYVLRNSECFTSKE